MPANCRGDEIMRESEPIDRAYLARFTRGSAQLEQEILELFAGQMPTYVARLRSAATRAEWKQAAHGIKGAALAVGARKLSALAIEAESLDFEDRGRRQPAIDAIESASNDACRYIACLFATA